MSANAGAEKRPDTDKMSSAIRFLFVIVLSNDENVALADTLGHDAINESRKSRQEQIAVLDAGLLVREIFLVTAN